ncbi:MAG: TatD family hydrolase, partial [Magnetococcales bacterium]|nr:TatD family hydrolase [Magnetococcales bacterium]
GMVVPGVRLQDFSRVAALESDTLRIALGLHPVFLADHPADPGEVEAALNGWLTRLRPVAVGEIGLDYLMPPESFPAQLALLELQMQLAHRHGLPVILHVRRAHEPVLALIRRLGFSRGGIVHAFGGSLEQGREYVKQGFKLGFGGVMTLERARRIRQVAVGLSEGALVVETDAPDLSPAGHWGERNEPAFLSEVVATLAALRGVAPERMREITTANARDLLGWV